jgi:hypothetical protein
MLQKNTHFCRTRIFLSRSSLSLQRSVHSTHLGHLSPILEIQHLVHPIPLSKTVQTTLSASTTEYGYANDCTDILEDILIYK